MKKVRFFWWLFTVFVVSWIALPQSFAESLWSDDAWFADPYSDYRASREGDILTVIITENLEGKNSATSSGGSSVDISMEAGQGIFDFVPPASFKRQSTRQGERSNQRQMSLSGVITCQVVEVLENGNLRIAGSKEIYLNKEREIMHIEGVVNPRFISAQNTVYSTQLVDVIIKLEGTLKPKQRSGLIGILGGLFGSILDILF
ncbi:flagellar basal body L-ring protein FlgH [Thermatribacter velox]|uniref:Flagellar basal body L-ring protein FlgH n=1 Tax=Thermatribacter velox TaxID=3039681 RepID=A0ABZ2YEJ3_9BACT